MIPTIITALIVALLLSPAPDVATEQTLRAIKALTESYKQELMEACDEPRILGGPRDIYHEDLALRVAIFSEESARIAQRLTSERGRSSAAHMFSEAAKYRIKAYICHSRRQHLEYAERHISEAEKIAEADTISPSVRKDIIDTKQDIIVRLKNHDMETERRTSTFLFTGLKTSPPTHPPTNAEGENAYRDLSIAKPRLDAPLITLGFMSSGTSSALKSLPKSDLLRPGDLFERIAKRAIYDAAVASWSGGANVPYGEGVDVCQQGRRLGDVVVTRTCDIFSAIGVSLADTDGDPGSGHAASVTFARRIFRVRFERMHAGAILP